MGFGAVVDEGGMLWIIVFFSLKMPTLPAPHGKGNQEGGQHVLKKIYIYL
jgi:hypothetical protein